MKSETPQISWHNREPVLSCDVQLYEENNDSRLQYRIATASFDHHVIIWLATQKCDGDNISIEVLADLNRHSKPVNIVRFSPLRGFLASGDNDGSIIVWKLQESIDDDKKETNSTNVDESIDDYGIVNKEHWIQYKTLRGHLEDVVDLSWSSDGQSLVSGSVDNHAFVWEVSKAKQHSLDGHKSYVQGVAYDPLGSYLVTLSADRSLRVFEGNRKRVTYRVYKENVNFKEESKMSRLFYDDTFRSFCRRISFSPNGEFLIASSGIVEILSDGNDVKFVNCVYLFMRNALNKPAAYFTTGNKYNMAVSCCPVVFELRENVSNPFPFPYRVVFAVATQDSVLFFDTQHDIPFAIVGDIHYTSLSDIRWSPDGRMLFVSSTDGYCTFITFDYNEIGNVYNGETYSFDAKVDTKSIASSPTETKEAPKPSITPESSKTTRKTPESAKITSFFTKLPAKKPDENNQSGCKRKVVIDISEDSSTPKKKHQFNIENLKTLVVPIVPLTLSKQFDRMIESKPSEETEKPNGSNIQESMNSLHIDAPENTEKTGNTCEVKRPADAQGKKPRRVNFITLTTPKSNESK